MLWPPVGKTNPATKLSACSADTDNALSPTSSAKNCTNLATPKHTLLLLLKPRLAKYMSSQRASERTPGNDSSLLRGIFRRRRDKTDTNSPSSVSQSVYPRGVLYLSVGMSCSFIMPGRFLTRFAMRRPRPGCLHPLRIVFSYRPQVALKIMSRK